MNPGYPNVYAPVLRNPLLFHHHTNLSSPPYNPAHPRGTQATTNLYYHHPTAPYSLQSRYASQAPLSYNSQSYPYYSAMPKVAVYSIPTVMYPPTVSSKGLTLILIATLMLVALDLVIVRPQKR